MERVFRTHGTPTPDEALDFYKAFFGEDGEYVLKADGAAAEIFDEWFMRQLEEVTQAGFVTAQYAIWEVLDRQLRERHVAVPSELDMWELNRMLFDLTNASTARMVGLQIPAPVLERLTQLHFTLPEALDFPALAYRMGLIYQQLNTQAPVRWVELTRAATSIPLTTAERAGVDYARRRAGVFMRPIFDRSGQVWTANRELFPLRSRLAAAAKVRQGTTSLARELQNHARANGIDRDMTRVVRTEMADMRNNGAWQADSKRWGTNESIFRVPSRTACKTCLRLYLMPDGMPRIYDRAFVEACSEEGPNQGPQHEWKPKIGATHPNCVCPPWQKWIQEMQTLYARSAPARAAEIERLDVFGRGEEN